MSELKVIFLSDWLNNPYKVLLAAGLQNQGATVSEYEWSTLFLPALMRLGRPDILHLHTLHPFLRAKTWLTGWVKLCIFIAQVFILRSMGTRTFWTVHEWTDKISGGQDEISPAKCWLLGRFLAGLIVHCKSTGTQIEAAFGLCTQGKVYVIPHGNYVDCYANEISKSEAREKLHIESTQVTFLLFGDIYRYKGVLEAIAAFKAINTANTSLIIAGLPKQNNLENEINEQIEALDNITFVPKRIPDDDVQLFVNAADCVLVPYNVFTTSGIAILAMSFGRVCIAPDIGFFNDTLNASGAFLYDANYAHGLREAMAQAVQHHARLETMGDYNRGVANQWNWNTVARLTMNAYTGTQGDLSPEVIS